MHNIEFSGILVKSVKRNTCNG